MAIPARNAAPCCGRHAHISWIKNQPAIALAAGPIPTDRFVIVFAARMRSQGWVMRYATRKIKGALIKFIKDQQPGNRGG
jgi:hypothetical protein